MIPILVTCCFLIALGYLVTEKIDEWVDRRKARRIEEREKRIEEREVEEKEIGLIRLGVWGIIRSEVAFKGEI